MSNLINRFVAITALNEAQIEFDAHYWGLGEAKEIIDSLPTVNAIVIPDNATNGDVIKALFPKADIDGRHKEVYVVIDDEVLDFSENWWFAHYKENKE